MYVPVFTFLDTSLFCPTPVIVTANVSQEKSIENSNDENERNNKIGEHSKIRYRIR